MVVSIVTDHSTPSPPVSRGKALHYIEEVELRNAAGGNESGPITSPASVKPQADGSASRAATTKSILTRRLVHS